MAQRNLNGTANTPVEILLVEDNPGDVELTRRILKDSKFDLNINVVEDGEEAMAYLYKKEDYANVPYPNLILLDLNMPKMDGYQVLEKLKVHHVLQRIPVMILTSTAGEGHTLFEQGVHPSRFCRKPLNLTQFDVIVGHLDAEAAGAEAQALSQPQTQTKQPRQWWPFGKE